MSKQTYPGWPEPTEWASTLASMLQSRGEEYKAAEGIHDRQKALAGMLTQLVKHLNTLPNILNGDLAQPLMHLVDALDQANEGHKPALFANRTKAPGRKASVYWQTAKMQAVVAYYTLSEAGHSAPAKFVADEMNRAKLARRKGERQSPASVMRFVNEYELSKGDELPEVWASAARDKLAQFSANPEWPVSISDAASYVRRAFASPRLQRESS